MRPLNAAALLLALALPAAAGPAAAAAPAGRPVRRKVLVLYRPELIPGKVRDVAFMPVHQHAEMVLNWLGLEVDYLDADKPLPDPASLTDARGVLTWFPTTNAFRDPRPVCRWLDGAMRAGLKVVLLGRVGLERAGAKGPGGLDPECADALATLGVRYRALRAVGPLDVKTLAADPAVVGFERKPDPSEQGTLPLARLSAGSTAYLRLELDDDPTLVTEPVGVTPRGGLALDPFLLYANVELDPDQYAWVTDPFAFFARAFALQGLPRPDPTTLDGLRLYMSHVDGDGFFNPSELDGHAMSGQVFTREVLAERPGFPFTMSLIAGYLDLELYDDDASLRLERDALSRPNVEPAAHGYAHPLVWRTGKLALTIPGYAMDGLKETAGSARLIDERILPPGERVGLYLWTGDALPRAEDVADVRRAGLLDLNGGGGRFDAAHPSYAYLLPLSRPVGDQRQVYAADDNEDVFTNLWSGPYYGYRSVLETFERTGSPRRVKPVDVYVHYYSAERYAALKALDEVYDWARRQPLNPQFTGVYARAARDFFAMRVTRLGPGRYRLDGGAGLRTVRFDDARGEPDLRASRGVIGYTRAQGSLYVSLDGSDPRVVVLAARPPRWPRLEEANFAVSAWKAAPGGVSFRKQGWWTSWCVLGGLVPGARYRVAGAGLDATLSAGADGRLRLDFPDAERGGPARPVAVTEAP